MAHHEKTLAQARRDSSQARVGTVLTFLAGLVVSLDGGLGWGGALRLALGAATANAELPGAGRLDPSRAGALAEQATVRLI